MKRPPDELTLLFRSRTADLDAALVRLIRAETTGIGTESAVDELERTVRETRILSDLLGRRRMILGADAWRAHMKDVPIAAWPQLPFAQAVEHFASRHPALANSVELVQEVYAKGGFAAIQSATLTVTKRVQKAVGGALEAGRDAPSAIQMIRDLTDWRMGYAQTAYRTNVATAYSAGQHQQIRDPAVASVIGAFRLRAIRDSRARDDHLKMDGTTAPPDHEVWGYRTTPLDYSCRCSLDYVDHSTLRRMGLVAADGTIRACIPNPHVRAAPGFGGRTDLAIYGGA